MPYEIWQRIARPTWWPRKNSTLNYAHMILPTPLWNKVDADLAEELYNLAVTRMLVSIGTAEHVVNSAASGPERGSMRHPLSARFHQLLQEIGELHDKKQADYGRESDPFANVRGSKEWGIDGWIGAMIRLNDKVKRLQVYAQRGSLSNEGVEDSLKDIAVYALIALCLWEEGRPEFPLAEGFKPRTEPQAAPTGHIHKCMYPWLHSENCTCLR